MPDKTMNIPEARFRSLVWNGLWLTSGARRTKSIKKLDDEHLLNIIRLAMNGNPPFHKNYAVFMADRLLKEVRRRIQRSQAKVAP